MVERKIPFYDIKVAMDSLQKQASEAVLPNLDQFTDLYQRRIERLNQVAKRLEPNLGKAHPKVVAMREAAARTNEVKLSLQTAIERQKRRPKVGPDDWAVFGQVLAREGEPVTGVQVQVLDRDSLYDELLREETTDEYGDFAVVYHKQDFAKFLENLPDLYVQVKNSQGNLVYSSRDSIRYDAGRIEYFEIRLTERTSATGA